MEVIDFKEGVLRVLDQRLLPEKEEHVVSLNAEETIRLIKTMAVRGAPLIGIAGAYAMVQNPEMQKEIRTARPTAVDLQNSVDFMSEWINSGKDAKEGAEKWSNRVWAECKRITEYGEKLILDGYNVLTHCNAGEVAVGKYGTALGIIKRAAEKKNVFVYVDETRPRFQGAITAWELSKENIPHRVIVDNAAGYFMKRGEVDAVFVGADRILKNGDIANKIGTYMLAVLARENKIPFYVAAPSSTFDRKTENIPIEYRNEKEILEVKGIKIYNNEKVLNPAFDVTPAEYITAYITEKGAFGDSEELWKNIRE
ncbi:S-methyl-5-thioribose-1-phosphate isomerase [Candidatus Micrarchaeota archaeon]|nr:S-methyl-5-thioribose-1-phosphate isomerase [Candidatus Micrarchaeota archaeon]